MKKLLSLFIFVIITNCLLAQFTQFQSLGNTKTLVTSKGGLKADTAWIIPYFVDTAAANITNVANKYPGNFIRILNNKVYVRSQDTLSWILSMQPVIDTTNQFVSSVWRVPGKDTVFYQKGSTVIAIKDSTGGGGIETDPLSIHLTGTSVLTGNITVDGLTNDKRIFINGTGAGNSGVDIYSEGGNLSLTSNNGVYIGQSGNDSAYIYLAGRTKFNDNSFTTSFSIASYKDAPEIDLKTISADRTITFVPTNNNGYLLLIHNQNTSGFSWLTAGSVVESDGTPITAIPRGLSWYKFDGVSGSATQGSWVHFTDNTGGGAGLVDGDYGDITVSGSGTAMAFDYKRKMVYAEATGTNANITAVAGTAYDLPAATLSTNRTIDMTNLNVNGDYIEFDNQEAGFTWSFTGQTVYDAYENAVTVLLANTRYIIRRSNGKLKIIN